MMTPNSVKSIYAPFLGLMTFLSPAIVRAEVPVIPMVIQSAPTLDGVLQKSEWQRALVLQAVNSKIDPTTKFYLQHDGTSLWVAVDNDEPEDGLPIAALRAAGAILSVDDAVEVALGTEGGSERAISMGGYAGAMDGKVARLERLYGFVVNAAGSTTRRYNESELPNALFEAKTSRRAKGWQTEMRIPFASLGLKNPAGREIFANFVRYRPPVNLAWTGPPNWNGYIPFPTGRIRLAANPSEAATGGQIEIIKPALATSQDFEQTFDEVATPSLEYFPLSNTVTGQVRLQPGGKGVLRVAGVTKEEVSERGGVVRLTVALPHRLKVDENIEAELVSRKADGTIDFQRKQNFKGSAIPEWSGTNAGHDYENDAVPEPWTRPVLKDNVVQLQHATIAFKNGGLPSSIQIPAGELLASPITLQLWSQGKLQVIAWDKPTTSTIGVRPIIYNRGRFGANIVEVRTEIDFDGFMTFQVRLKGKPKLDRVQLSCPLRIERARYLADRNVQKILALDSSGFKGISVGRYGGRYWMGAEDGGLVFTTDLPFFKAAQRRGEVAVVDNGTARSLVLTSIDRASQLTSDTILQFYLQATPARPQSKVTMDDYRLWFEEWSDYQGYPDLAKMDQVKERVQKSKVEPYMGKSGLPLILYFNQLLAENAPGFAQYRKELIAPPDRMWYQRAYDGPGKGVPSYLCCVRGPYGDLLLDGIYKLANEGGIGGVYMDGTTVGWTCDNPAHAGCNELRSPVWDQPGETRILGTRKFLKRLRGIFDERKGSRPYYMVAHTGGDIDINTLSLVDQMWEGEQLARYLPGYRVPQAQFAVGYSGAPWGYRSMFFDHTWLGQRGENWSLVYSLLYNTESQKNGVRAFQRPFEGPGSEFHPYWKGGQSLLKSSKSGNSKVSYYTAPQAAMVVASNLNFHDDDIEINVAKLADVKDEKWVDLLTGETHQAKAGVLQLAIPAYQGVVLRPFAQTTEAQRTPALRDQAAINVPTVTGMNLDSWQLNAEAKGVARTDLPDVNGAPWLLIKSAIGGDSVRARLQGVAIGQDAEVTFKLKAASGPVMQLDMGPISLVHEGNWQVRGMLDGWNEANVNQIPWAIGQEITLNLVFHNDELTIRVDDQVLVDRMKFRNDGLGLRPLQIWTIAGHSLAFQLVSLSAQPDLNAVKEIRHPVNP